MALYEFEGRKPQVTQGAFVAESTLVIGDVQIGKDAYIGHGAILRGDYGAIHVGEGTAIEEGVIVHARPDDRTIIGNNVTVGRYSA
jgi:carbonic anhydrase/acetyltransferase-like protein (isoleucine patch superfamily)